MLFFRFIYEIYICGIFYGVFIESAFKRLESPHHSCSMVGAEPAGWGLKPLPLHVDALFSWTRKHNKCGGGSEVAEGGGKRQVWPCETESGVRRSWGRLPLLLFLDLSYPPLLYYHPKRPNGSSTPPFKCCSSSLAKGTISEQYWLECWIAELNFSLHPKLLIGTLAMSIPPASQRKVEKQRGEEGKMLERKDSSDHVVNC